MSVGRKMKFRPLRCRKHSQLRSRYIGCLVGKSSNLTKENFEFSKWDFSVDFSGFLVGFSAVYKVKRKKILCFGKTCNCMIFLREGK